MSARGAVLATTAALVWPAQASAHALAVGDGFIAGVAHPLGGWDHLLAMILVGMLSTRLERRDLWALPATFVAVMIAASGAGFAGLSLPGLETGIGLSVLVLGVMLAAPTQKALAYAAVAVFAALHGNAHGLEAPLQATPGLYVSGFATATATLHVVGVLVAALCAEERRGTALLRGAGVASAAAGALFVFT